MSKEKVYETLKASSEPLRPGQIAELAGVSKDEVDKAITALKKEEKVFSPKRCFYSAK